MINKTTKKSLEEETKIKLSEKQTKIELLEEEIKQFKALVQEQLVQEKLEIELSEKQTKIELLQEQIKQFEASVEDLEGYVKKQSLESEEDLLNSEIKGLVEKIKQLQQQKFDYTVLIEEHKLKILFFGVITGAIFTYDILNFISFIF